METIHLSEVIDTFSKILNEEIIFDNASIWARNFIFLENEDNLMYFPSDMEDVIFDSLLYLEGLDILVNENSFLHNLEDVKVYFNENLSFYSN